jgi:N-acetylneuraminate synthase
MSIKLVADIGINHNGDMNIVKRLIDVCAAAGIDYVKFQKRNPDVCVPDHQKNIPRVTPWGTISYIEYKYKLELDGNQYEQIDQYCKEKGIKWFASAWDMDSVVFLQQFGDSIVKVPSAKLTDLSLLQWCRGNFKKMIISTGMSTEDEIINAVKVGNPDVVMHCNSAYPANIKDLNLYYIKWLQNMYVNKDIGYSGHEFGLVTTFAAVALGATWIERHVTLDRMMWGSDQLSSIEPAGIFKLVRGIRDIESALGVEEGRKVFECEMQKRKELRG